MQDYDFNRIKQLLKDFYNLTQIKICLYDSAENEICFFPEKYTAFCENLRQDKLKDSLCKECDRRAFAECKRTHQPYSYTCHAGLLECFSPILFNERIIGYIVIGQIRTENNSSIVSYSDNLQTLYQCLPLIPKDRISSAMHILEACAGYAYLKKLISSQSKSLEERLRDYINIHLTDDLSVQKLCDTFHLSRVDLYDVFKQAFRCTIAEFIKKSRLEKACELLKETNLPIYKVAVQCGIPDYNYFTKNFTKTFYKSPRQYRRDSLTNPYEI